MYKFFVNLDHDDGYKKFCGLDGDACCSPLCDWLLCFLHNDGTQVYCRD